MKKRNYRVLVAENDRTYLKILKDYIAKSDIFAEFELAYDGQEVIDLAQKFNPDVVILSIILPTIDGIGVIRALKEILPNTVFVIESSIKEDFIVRLAFDAGANLFFAKPFDYFIFENRILQLLENEPYDKAYLPGISTPSQNEILMKITKEIQRIGISTGIKGFKYVRYAIKLKIEDTYADKGMMKFLYPAIAEKFDTTPQCVERNIRHAIEGAWVHGSMSYIDEVFGFSIDADKGKPTNSAFIATLAEKIKLEMDL